MTIASDTLAWAKGPLTAIGYSEPCLACAGSRGGNIDYQRRRWRADLPEGCRNVERCTAVIRAELEVGEERNEADIWPEYRDRLV